MRSLWQQDGLCQSNAEVNTLGQGPSPREVLRERMLKAAQNNLREQSSSCDLRREVEGGPRTNLPDDLPRATPLAWARDKGHAKVEQMLIAAGARNDGFSDLTR